MHAPTDRPPARSLAPPLAPSLADLPSVDGHTPRDGKTFARVLSHANQGRGAEARADARYLRDHHRADARLRAASSSIDGVLTAPATLVQRSFFSKGVCMHKSEVFVLLGTSAMRRPC